MSKVDLLVMSILAIIMLLFCWIGTHWAFFCAGFCGAVVFFICVGFWLRGLEYNERSKEWDNFLHKLDNNETISPEITVANTDL